MVKNKGQQMKRGFTLLELLLVLLILGILVGVAMPRYIQSTKVAKQIAFESNLKDIIKALEEYKIQQQFQNFTYPSSLDVLKEKFVKEPINPYTNKSMLGGNPTDSGILYQPIGTSYKLCIVQRDVDDVNNNGVVEEVLPLSTKTACIGNTQTSVGVTFARNSVAYTGNGTQVGVNVPRFEAGKFGQAVMVEEGTTNALSYAFTSDANLLQYFYAIRGNTTIDTTQTPPVSGQKVVKHYASLNDSYIEAIDANGVNYVTASTAKLAVTGGSYVTFSIWAKGQNGGEQIEIFIFDYASNTGSRRERKYQTFTITNTWQRYVVTVQTASDAVRAWARVDNNVAGQTIYWCAPQLENKAYVTSFTPSTRSPEFLTIPTDGVLNPQEGTVEFWWMPINQPASTIVSQQTSPPIFEIGTYWQPNSLILWVYAWVYAGAGLRLLVRGNEATTWTGDWTIISGFNWYQLNCWYHIALRWQNGNTFYVFVNGVKYGPYVSSLPLTSIAGNIMSLGKLNASSGGSNALFDDLRISSRARTDEEIAAAYQSGQPLPVDAWTTLKLDFNGDLSTQSGVIP